MIAARGVKYPRRVRSEVSGSLPTVPGWTSTSSSISAMICVMERVNLTLDPATAKRLVTHAKTHNYSRAAFARLLLREALDHRDALARTRKLARDYAAGRPDAVEILRELESAQIEWPDYEEAS